MCVGLNKKEPWKNIQWCIAHQVSSYHDDQKLDGDNGHSRHGGLEARGLYPRQKLLRSCDPSQGKKRYAAICVSKSFCAGTSQFLTNYSLVNVYMTIENGHFDWENPFEMVMFHGHVQLTEGICLQFFAFDFLSLFLSVWGPNNIFFSDLLGGCTPRLVGQMVHPQV